MHTSTILSCRSHTRVITLLHRLSWSQSYVAAKCQMYTQIHPHLYRHKGDWITHEKSGATSRPSTLSHQISIHTATSSPDELRYRSNDCSLWSFNGVGSSMGRTGVDRLRRIGRFPFSSKVGLFRLFPCVNTLASCPLANRALHKIYRTLSLRLWHFRACAQGNEI